MIELLFGNVSGTVLILKGLKLVERAKLVLDKVLNALNEVEIVQ